MLSLPDRASRSRTYISVWLPCLIGCGSDLAVVRPAIGSSELTLLFLKPRQRATANGVPPPPPTELQCVRAATVYWLIPSTRIKNVFAGLRSATRTSELLTSIPWVRFTPLPLRLVLLYT